MARKKIIAGNWKMNKTPSEAVALVEELKPLVANEEVDVVFCVPAIDIVPVVEACKGTNIQVGAENMYFEESGAIPGEISPAMLTDAGVKYVVLGHSERRDYFGETNEDVNKKVLKAFEHGITPIMCCGESLEQREQGVTMDFIRQQVKVGFQNVTADQAKTSGALHTSRSGRLEPERPLPQSRQRKCARESVTVLRKSMTRRQRKQSVFSTAGLSMQEMQQSYLHRQILTEDW